MFVKFYVRTFLLVLFCLNLAACTSPACREWEFGEYIMANPCFNSGRMYLGPASDLCHLELELNRTQSGLRMYVNILLLEAPPYPDDPGRTTLNILFEGEEEPWIVYPYLLTGGQRLLLPGDVSDYLIEMLMLGHFFTLQLGRQKLEIIPDNFASNYQKLMAIPIAIP